MPHRAFLKARIRGCHTPRMPPKGQKAGHLCHVLRPLATVSARSVCGPRSHPLDRGRPRRQCSPHSAPPAPASAGRTASRDGMLFQEAKSFFFFFPFIFAISVPGAYLKNPAATHTRLIPAVLQCVVCFLLVARETKQRPERLVQLAANLPGTRERPKHKAAPHAAQNINTVLKGTEVSALPNEVKGIYVCAILENENRQLWKFDLRPHTRPPPPRPGVGDSPKPKQLISTGQARGRYEQGAATQPLPLPPQRGRVPENTQTRRRCRNGVSTQGPAAVLQPTRS